MSKRKMKPVIQRRTTIAALAKVGKRLDVLRERLADIAAEVDDLEANRAFLVSQLPMPLPEAEGSARASTPPAIEITIGEGIRFPTEQEDLGLGPEERAEQLSETTQDTPALPQSVAPGSLTEVVVREALEGTPTRFQGVTPELEAMSRVTPEVIADVTACWGAIGPHQHRITETGWDCLAPEEQRRKS